MATLTTRSEPQALSNQVATLLRTYEDFSLQEDQPGYSGYVVTLKTNLLIHRRHTKADLFKHHSFYVGAQFTMLPNFSFLESWLIKARMTTDKGVRKGDYTAEEYIGGEWQTVKYKYNRWIYHDRVNNRMIGQVQVTDLVKNDLDTKNKPTRIRKGGSK